MNTIDYESQREKLLRRQQMAQALQQIGMSGGPGVQMVSGRVVQQSPLASLAPLLQGALGAYSGRKADKDLSALDTQRGSDITAAIKAYTDAKGTDKEAALGALASQSMNPSDYAKALVAGAMKPTSSPYAKVDPSKYTPESLQQFAATQNPTVLRARETQGPLESIIGPDGKPILASRSDSIGKTPYSKPLVTNTVNLPENKYPNAFEEGLGKSDVAALDKYRATAEASTSALKTLTELGKLNPTAMSGGGAETRAKVGNWLSGWTGVDITDPSVLADTQKYNALVTKSVLDSLGGSLGAGVSNADVSFIQKTVPQLEYSQKARSDLIDYMARRAKENVQLYQRARDYGEKNKGLKGFDPIGGAFPGSSPMPAGATNIDALLDKYK